MLLRPSQMHRPAPLVALAAGVAGLVVWVLTTSGLLVVAEVLARLTGVSIGVAWFADVRLHPANALGSIALCFAALVVCNLLCGCSALGRRSSRPVPERPFHKISSKVFSEADRSRSARPGVNNRSRKGGRDS